MAKLYAINKIVRVVKDGKRNVEEVILPRTVFEATVAQAKELIDLKAARQATDPEIKIADELAAKANGLAYAQDVLDEMPVPQPNQSPSAATTGISNDPKGAQKGKSD